jgi:hypothetical protein
VCGLWIQFSCYLRRKKQFSNATSRNSIKTLCSIMVLFNLRLKYIYAVNNIFLSFCLSSFGSSCLRPLAVDLVFIVKSHRRNRDFILVNSRVEFLHNLKYLIDPYLFDFFLFVSFEDNLLNFD